MAIPEFSFFQECSTFVVSPGSKGTAAVAVGQPVLTPCPETPFKLHHKRAVRCPSWPTRCSPRVQGLPSLPTSCLPAVPRRPRAERRPRNWLPGCWGPPARRRRPAASAWSAAPPRWTAAGARTATPGARAGRGTSPGPLRMMSAVREASLGQTGGNRKKGKGSHREDLSSFQAPVGPQSEQRCLCQNHSTCPYAPHFCMHIQNTSSSNTSFSVI